MNTNREKAKQTSGEKHGNVRYPVKSPANRRITCPICGNDWHFFEIAEDVMLTTRYVQNPDGSFTPRNDDSRILGEVKLYCGECKADISQFHDRFIEMLF